MTSMESNPDCVIRQMRPEEMDEFLDLMQIAFKNSIEQDRLDTGEMRKLMKKVNRPVFRVLTRLIGMRMEFHVAAVNDVIASGIQINIQKDDVYVGNLMTHPEHRRKGHARALLNLAYARAHATGKKKVRLDAVANNTNAVTLYKDEGFETVYHYARFDSDSFVEDSAISETVLTVKSVNKIDKKIMGSLLDYCFPPLYLETKGRDKFIKEYIPSRIVRYLVRRFGNQSINTYELYKPDVDRPFGYVQVSQSGVEDRIEVSSPLLAPEDNDLFFEALPTILSLEKEFRGLTVASIKSSMHRTDLVSKIEAHGFKKIREGISMRKSL